MGKKDRVQATPGTIKPEPPPPEAIAVIKIAAAAVFMHAFVTSKVTGALSMNEDDINAAFEKADLFVKRAMKEF